MASLSFYDSAGQVRSIVGIDENEIPLVRLLDQAGQSRLNALVQDGDGLVIAGDEDTQSGVFGIAGGSPLLSLLEAGRSRARLQVAPDGSPSLRLFDGDGRQTSGLTVGASEAPLMTSMIRDSSGPRSASRSRRWSSTWPTTQQVRLVIGVARDGRPSVSFLSENGQPIQELPLEASR